LSISSCVRRRTDTGAQRENNAISLMAARAAPGHLFSFSILKEFTMKSAHRFSRILPAIALVAVLGLSACAGMTRQEQGTATGAVIGGVAGNVLCGGLLCTCAGAAIGGVIGHEATKR
jgi:osmotically inducible lipoprotein OsmB